VGFIITSVVESGLLIIAGGNKQMKKAPDLQFYLDRFRGEIGQEYVADMFRSWGFKVYVVPQGYQPDYDMEVTGQLNGIYRNFRVEVKHDYRAMETGNFVFEHDGLDHSKADYFAICGGDPIKVVYLMPLSEAKQFAHAWSDIRPVGKLKSGKPNYAAIIPEKNILNIPMSCKLIPPTNDTKSEHRERQAA